MDGGRQFSAAQPISGGSSLRDGSSLDEGTGVKLEPEPEFELEPESKRPRAGGSRLAGALDKIKEEKPTPVNPKT
jgi:hypothetical protein